MIQTAPKTDEERQALRAHNMDVFERHKVAMANRLKRHVPITKLVFDEDGQPDIEFQGEKFYDGDYYNNLEIQIEQFKRAPRRFSLQIPQPSQFDRIGERFLTEVLRRATFDAEATFAKNYPDHETFFLSVLGIGLGGHLPMLQDISKCAVMFLIDPNIETLYHSLELLDWEELFLHCESRGGQIEFLIGDDYAAHFHNMRSLVRWINAPSVDGMLMYTHYNNPMFNQFIQETQKQAGLFLAGLGFFDDEVKMLENTHTNLSGGTAHIYTQPNDPVIQFPCFVVGCGPSLDQDLKHIKENADKAIIVSSGSALGPLLSAGITPDFQLEVENEGILPIMSYVAEHHDISGICLVTSTTVEPEIVQYFDRIIYHFRPALAPFHFFSDSNRNTIDFHDPSVVNSSLGLALELGFREFYFFGCDMGTRDADMHHARNSYHFAPDAKLPDNDFCIKVPANFGGHTFTSAGLNWVKANVETAMARNLKGRTFYNCSDGAFLNGAIAKFGKSIKLPVPKDPEFKEHFVAECYGMSPVMEQETFEHLWDTETIRAALDQIFDKLREIVSEAAFLFDKSYLIEINKILYHSVKPIDRGIATWIRGTMQMMLLGVEYYGTRLKNDNKAIEFEEIIREELLTSINGMHEEASALIDRFEENYRAQN